MRKKRGAALLGAHCAILTRIESPLASTAPTPAATSAFSTAAAVAGLVTLQFCGLVNLCLGALLGRWEQALPDLVMGYGIGPLPAQLALCAVTAVVAVILRWCLVIRK